MTKQLFLAKLKSKLGKLPKKDIEERLSFYSEMIDDRIESGLSEEEAIAEVGSANDVALQIIEEIAAANTSEKETKSRRLSRWQIILLVLGSPLWIVLLLAAFLIVFAFYTVVWSVTAVFWVIELPFFIFSFISKGLFWVCKWISAGSLYITKKAFSVISLFKSF